ncbi:MAG: DNA primase [Acidobacteriota bacterium]
MAQDGFVQAVRDAADIARVISQHVNLKRSGRKLKGLCPFHSEKTPSFVVDPEKQLFYCFGCRTGGDALKFVMLIERLEFPEALCHLAGMFGVPVPRHSGGEGSETGRLLGLHQEAAAFYRQALAEPAATVARAYLERRGLAQSTVTELGLGYAPSGWDTLRNHLRRRHFRDEEMIRAGLAVARREKAGCYDRFRDRLVFPIERLGGGIIGFGGRGLGDDEPKYLNSPDSPLFNKGRQLYGLSRAREAIRDRDEVVVVEGYMDFASLWQAGIRHVVAVLGTGLTPAHARLIGRFTHRVVLAFDPDRAGRTAAGRAIPVLLADNHEVRVLSLPDGRDPDDVVRREGAEAFCDRLSAAAGCIDFLIDGAAAGLDLSDPGSRARAVSRVLPEIANLHSPVLQAAALDRVADRFDLEGEAIRAEFRRQTTRAEGRRPESRPSEEPLVRPAGTPAERRLLHLMLFEPELRGRLLSGATEQDFDGLVTQRLFARLLEQQQAGAAVSVESLASQVDETDRELLMGIAMEEFPGLNAHEGEACWNALRRDRLEKESHRLQRQLQHDADSEVGGSHLDDLLRRKLELRRMIDAL